MSTFAKSPKDNSRQYFGFNCGRADKQSRQRLSDKNEVDEIFVEGMNRLSFDELQREQEDLHGVSADFTEKADDVKRMLVTLHSHLQHLKPGSAYESAETMNQDYVSNRDLRMTFLRANRYDPKASANQMIRYFDFKSKLFGEDKLTRDILLSDLNDDDIACMLRGNYQISAVKDRANRVILMQFPGLRAPKSIENELRSRFYINMDLIKSLNTANRSVVYINYGVGDLEDHTKGAGGLQFLHFGMAMPFPTSGFHLCFSEKAETLVGKAVFALLPPSLKAKVKFHFGSHMECLYQMSTFGIPEHALPLSITKNEVNLQHHMAWYNNCFQRETESVISGWGSIVPNENDVLCVGKKVNSVGNNRIRDLAALHSADWYNTGSSKERRLLVDLIMDDVRKNGGRFLKPDEHDSHDWQELSVDEIRTKIHQLFRNLKKRANSTQKPPTLSPLQSKTLQAISNVTENDILFGRMYDHVGNQRLRQLVRVMSGEYNASNRGRKKEIADFLVIQIKNKGGRFLKPTDDGQWVEVSDTAAEKKVSSHFRNNRRGKSTGDEN
ncbi:unnamed protein product [Cylindrotheca closterium]|uniref:DUF6824 domain-containing protein n=1 Tax=Cylindrotheca closterium TaxID=2856 RepID=A0AAD2CIQ9_9STRA|nr:unnamed protein product [Cylindrotheca closterium]